LMSSIIVELNKNMTSPITETDEKQRTKGYFFRHPLRIQGKY
jgi:hypothetical protein